MIRFPGLSEDSSGSAVNELQLSSQLFKETCKDSVTVVEPTEDKHMDKLFFVVFVSFCPLILNIYVML